MNGASFRSAALATSMLAVGCAAPVEMEAKQIYSYHLIDSGTGQGVDGSTSSGLDGSVEVVPDASHVNPGDGGPPPQPDASPSGADAGEPPASPDAAVVAVPDAGQSGDCPGSQTRCGQLCVDLNTSANNCGSCGHHCPGGGGCDGSGMCQAPANCDYALRNGHDYLFCGKTATFSSARNSCINYGLDLAIVDDQAENDFLHAASNGDTWIGANDQDSEGKWRWVVPGDAKHTAGANVSFTDWTSGEPNNSQSCTIPVVLCSDEDCGEITDMGTWNDADCSKKYAYACESY